MKVAMQGLIMGALLALYGAGQLAGPSSTTGTGTNAAGGLKAPQGFDTGSQVGLTAPQGFDTGSGLGLVYHSATVRDEP